MAAEVAALSVVAAAVAAPGAAAAGHVAAVAAQEAAVADHEAAADAAEVVRAFAVGDVEEVVRGGVGEEGVAPSTSMCRGPITIFTTTATLLVSAPADDATIHGAIAEGCAIRTRLARAGTALISTQNFGLSIVGDVEAVAVLRVAFRLSQFPKVV